MTNYIQTYIKSVDFMIFQRSGLSELVADMLKGLVQLPHWVLLLLVCLIVSYLTEVLNNSATTSVLLPIVSGLVCMISSIFYIEHITAAVNILDLYEIFNKFKCEAYILEYIG